MSQTDPTPSIRHERLYWKYKTILAGIAPHATLRGVEVAYKLHVHTKDHPFSLDQMAELERSGIHVSHCEDLHAGVVFKGRCYMMEVEGEE